MCMIIYTIEVANIFKELDLVDRVPEEQLSKVHDTVQEVVTKTTPSPQKKEMQEYKGIVLLEFTNSWGKKRSKRQERKVSFHSNSKEGQCQRMFKLPYNYIHFTQPVELC